MIRLAHHGRLSKLAHFEKQSGRQEAGSPSWVAVQCECEPCDPFGFLNSLEFQDGGPVRDDSSAGGLLEMGCRAGGGCWAGAD